MFFILSKALLFLISPFFWLIVFVAIFFFSKNEKWRRKAKWISIIFFVFFSNTVIFSEFCQLWEVPGVKISTVKKHDVAIVLGGMFEYNSDLENISIRRPGDRLFQAITLYKTGKVEKLLISGDSGYITDRGLHEASQVKEILILWGIAENDIITEEISKNTHQNAVETSKTLKQNYPHFDSFILVTSGIHMKRAHSCFYKEGLDCTPFSTDLYANQTSNYFWDQYIIPNMYTIILWNELIKEVVGHVSYKIAGYN